MIWLTGVIITYCNLQLIDSNGYPRERPKIEFIEGFQSSTTMLPVPEGYHRERPKIEFHEGEFNTSEEKNNNDDVSSSPELANDTEEGKMSYTLHKTTYHSGSLSGSQGNNKPSNPSSPQGQDVYGSKDSTKYVNDQSGSSLESKGNNTISISDSDVEEDDYDSFEDGYYGSPVSTQYFSSNSSVVNQQPEDLMDSKSKNITISSAAGQNFNSPVTTYYVVRNYSLGNNQPDPFLDYELSQTSFTSNGVVEQGLYESPGSMYSVRKNYTVVNQEPEALLQSQDMNISNASSSTSQQNLNISPITTYYVVRNYSLSNHQPEPSLDFQTNLNSTTSNSEAEQGFNDSPMSMYYVSRNYSFVNGLPESKNSTTNTFMSSAKQGPNGSYITTTYYVNRVDDPIGTIVYPPDRSISNTTAGVSAIQPRLLANFGSSNERQGGETRYWFVNGPYNESLINGTVLPSTSTNQFNYFRVFRTAEINGSRWKEKDKDQTDTN